MVGVDDIAFARRGVCDRRRLRQRRRGQGKEGTDDGQLLHREHCSGAARIAFQYEIADTLYGDPIRQGSGGACGSPTGNGAMADKADVWQGTLALMVLKTLETLGPAARLRYRAADRADQRAPPLAQLRNALPRPAQARAGGLRHVRMGRLGQQPQGEVLPAHPGRAEATRQGSARVGAHDRRSSPAS